MIPADAVVNHFLADAAITAITRVMWVGPLIEPHQLPALSVQISERPAYPGIEASFRDTRADLSVSAVAPVYQVAYELAEAIRASLHGIFIEDGISIGPITWDRLDQAIAANYGEAIIYQIPQVFTCNIRRP